MSLVENTLLDLGIPNVLVNIIYDYYNEQLISMDEFVWWKVSFRQYIRRCKLAANGEEEDVPSLKGISADVIILEEAAFIPIEMFNQVVVPLLGDPNKTVIASNKAVEDINWYEKLLNAK